MDEIRDVGQDERPQSGGDDDGLDAYIQEIVRRCPMLNDQQCEVLALLLGFAR